MWTPFKVGKHRSKDQKKQEAPELNFKGSEYGSFLFHFVIMEYDKNVCVPGCNITKCTEGNVSKCNAHYSNYCNIYITVIKSPDRTEACLNFYL